MDELLELHPALIGAGNICQTAHIPCLIQSGVDIVCIIDPNTQAIEAARKLLPPAVKFITSSKVDLPSGVNCAIVCSPTALHAGQVQTLLENGMHVLCEKPMACTSADAERIVQLANQYNRVLQIGYFRRFHSNSQNMRNWLRNGQLGKPLSCVIRSGRIFASPPASILNRSLSGGGILMDFGVHVIDRLYSWFDDLDLIQYSCDSQGGLEVNCHLELDGIIASTHVPIDIILSWTNNLGNYNSVEFEMGSVTFSLNNGYELELKSSKPIPFINEDHNKISTIGFVKDSSRIGYSCNQLNEFEGSHYLTAGMQVSQPRNTIDYFCDQWKEFERRIAGMSEQLTCLADAIRTTKMVETCYADPHQLDLKWGW